MKTHKYITTFIISCLLSIYILKAQRPNLDSVKFEQENIFVHGNDTFFFPGEYFYFSIYCFNRVTKRPSDVSKIAHVQLINESTEEVFYNKIDLFNGLGQGDFFIPLDIASGTYKMVVYTNLMRNDAQNDHFEMDIMVLNPYTNDQEVFWDNNGDIEHSDKNGIQLSNNNVNKLLLIKGLQSKYNIRSKVEIELVAKDLASYNYSISVRKFDAVFENDIPQIENYAVKNKTIGSKTSEISSKTSFVPEIRGENIKGKVLLKSGQEINIPMRLLVSITGNNSYTNIIITKSDGNFIFPLNRNYEIENLEITPLNNGNDYEVILSTPKEITFKEKKFKKFQLDRNMEELIKQRSIHNQIENNYFSFRPDSIKLSQIKTESFYDGENIRYVLDEYTRFKTLKETITEIVEDVFVTELNNKKVFQIRTEYPLSEQLGFLPLVVIDGNVIEDITTLLDYDARKIKEIDVVHHQYVLGPQIYQGIVNIKTFNGDYSENTYTASNTKLFNLIPKQPLKNYFRQVYPDKNYNETIPDFRHQLLWNPRITQTKERKKLVFYTSDVKGVFSVCLEGLTNDGRPISLQKVFNVE
ncbi:hypothetical protein [Maribacter sp. 2210JD10-5]|uniref:hypothetical protein n=1 Tax=Maribacter sp. 2210JD10-5 TaxID=3386272 RepID=UPI0039BC366B